MDKDLVDNSSANIQIQKRNESPEEARSFKIKAGIYAASLAVLTALIGGSVAVSKARKTQDDFFKHAEQVGKDVKTAQALHAEGVALAFRALAWGTVWAVGGVSLVCFGIYKLSGANDLQDFRIKMGQKLPKLSRPRQANEPEIRTFRELMEYFASQTNKPPPPPET